MTTFKLNNGISIPSIGLGTWRAEDKDAYKSVLTALNNGYTHIDTAAMYGNEEQVGKAIKESGIARENLFITTKLDNSDHKQVQKALDTSLSKLGLDYVDLYLIHWPVPINPETEEQYDDWTFLDTYKSLQKVYKVTGKIKAIGVCNFTASKLEELLADPVIDVVPAVNQVELHPLLPQPELLEFLKQHDIKAESYSPLGSQDAPLADKKEVKQLAAKYKVDAAQVLISWGYQRGTIVLPKSVTPARIVDNKEVVELEEADVEVLNGLEGEYGRLRTSELFKVF